MKCPHLKTFLFSLCRSEGRFYSPSMFELHEYCKGEGFGRCPLYDDKNAARREATNSDERSDIAKREE